MPTAVIIAAVLIVTSLSGGGQASAQSVPASSPAVSYGPTASAPTPDCMTNLLNMSDCLSYVQAGAGGASKPDKACCPELAGLVESSPQCLCYLLGGDVAEQYGFKINMAKALKLPAVCGVQTPPTSLCSLFGVPVAAPVANGAASPIFPPSSSLSPGPQPSGGFAASPSTRDHKSDASRSITYSALSLFSIAISMFFFY